MLVILTITSCNTEDGGKNTNVLFEVERSFSDMSVREGMNKAFLHFCDEEGVILRPDRYPIVGELAIQEYLETGNDSLITLSWKPLDAFLSASGDLGFTYGTYLLESKNSAFSPREGTYITIWRKNSNNEWRFLLDTGQEGLGDD